jgi:DNA-binding protein H-NS
MDIDLNSLSLAELKELAARVDKAIASFQDRKRKQALSELEDVARSLGFSLSELTGAKIARKRASSGARYANPADPNQTWTGKGRRPKWFHEALKAGKSAADLAI